MKMFILVAKSCDECGGTLRIMFTKNQPNKYTEIAFTKGLGYCTSRYEVKEIEIKENEIIILGQI